MLFNNSTNEDPRSFFYYKGDFYINGTEIILKDDYINTRLWNGKKLWKYARYDRQTVYNGQVSHFFCSSRFDWVSFNRMGLDNKEKQNYAPYFVVSAIELENAIEEITKPIKLDRAETEAMLENMATPKRTLGNPQHLVLWGIYIAVLIGSLIFNEFYIIWVIATFIFLKLKDD